MISEWHKPPKRYPKTDETGGGCSMNAYQCGTCGKLHAVPSIARDCELRHEGEQ